MPIRFTNDIVVTGVITAEPAVVDDNVVILSQLEAALDLKLNISTAASTYIPLSQKGASLGITPLGSDSKVPSIYLPGYVDDIIEVANYAALPVIGESDKLYVTQDTNKTYRWTGSSYVEVSPSDVNSVFGRTGIVSALEADYNAFYPLLSGSYNNPSWINQLAYSKLTGVPYSNGSTDGILSSADWTTFNNKQNTITPAALTKTDDTNVTLTLGGSPSTALLNATSITVGWTGTLADARIASAATWNAKESALTFSTGLTRTTNTITVNQAFTPTWTDTHRFNNSINMNNAQGLVSVVSNSSVVFAGGTSASPAQGGYITAYGNSSGTPGSVVVTLGGSNPASIPSATFSVKDNTAGDYLTVAKTGAITLSSLSAGGIVSSTGGVLGITTSGASLTDVVHLTGDETINGDKTLTGVLFSDRVGQLFENTTAGTDTRNFTIQTTGGSLRWGVASSAGVFWSGSSTYAGTIGTNGATPFEIATNGVVRQSISSAGNHDFKTGTALFGGALTGTSITLSAQLTSAVGGSGVYGYYSTTNADGAFVQYSNSSGIVGYIGSPRQIIGGGSANNFAITANNELSLYAGGVFGLGFTSSLATIGVPLSGTSAIWSGNSTVGGDLNVAGQGRFKGWYTSGTGHALETGVSGSVGSIVSYNRTTSAYQPLSIDGSSLTLQGNGNGTIIGGALTGTSATLNSPTARNFIINATGGAYLGMQSSGIDEFYIGRSNVVGSVSGFYDYYTISGIGQRWFANAGEKMRLTTAGFFKASNDGTYYSSTHPAHELCTNGTIETARFSSSNASPNGIVISYSSATPNGSNNPFITGYDSTTVRFFVASNGGLYNYSANNTNLSDERVKKDIIPMESQWDSFKKIEFTKFKYKDQTHDDYNYGVIAQQVLKVAPHFVDTDGFGEAPKKGKPLMAVYDSDIHYAAHKALQEALIRIEKLENIIKKLKL